MLNHKGTERSKIEAVKRPTVSAAGTSQDWLYFLSRWEDYVKATNVKGADQAIQLLECCDSELRRGIQRNNGGVALSRKPAVKVENPTVARDRLHNMSQDREESVRAFGARLRGQAATCQYTKACTCLLVVDYTEENVADALITGLTDPEIKQGLLGEPDQPLSLERAMLYVESKEAAKTSVSLLDPGTSMGAVRQSGYKKTPRARRMQPNTDTVDEKCYFCGKTGHGKYPPISLRSAKCHAFGHTCGKCGKLNHADRVCRSKQPSTENAIFGTCCDITTHRVRQRRTLDHHVFDSTNDRWVKRQCLPQPTRHLLVKLIPDDYDRLKIARRPRRAQCYVDGMPDTGCQSCLAGTHILRQLGMSPENLIPMSQRMQAANKSGIHLLGAIIVEISLPDTKAKSKQMVYVTPSVTRLFLSRETCSDLGLISAQFPSTPTAAAASSIPLPGQSCLGSPHSTPSPPSGNGKASGPSREQRTLQTNTPPPPPPPGREAYVWMPDTLTATNWPNPSPRPGYGGEQECTGAALAVDIQSLHVQCLYTPTPSHDGRTAPASPMWTRGQHQSMCTRRPQCPFTGRTQSKSTSTAMFVSGYWKKSRSAHLTPGVTEW